MGRRRGGRQLGLGGNRSTLHTGSRSGPVCHGELCRPGTGRGVGSMTYVADNSTVRTPARRGPRPKPPADGAGDSGLGADEVRPRPSAWPGPKEENKEEN